MTEQRPLSRPSSFSASNNISEVKEGQRTISTKHKFQNTDGVIDAKNDLYQSAEEKVKLNKGELNNSELINLLAKQGGRSIKGEGNIIESIQGFSKDVPMVGNLNTQNQADSNPQHRHLFDDQEINSVIQGIQQEHFSLAKRTPHYDKLDQLLKEKVEIGLKMIDEEASNNSNKKNQKGRWNWMAWQDLDDIPNLAYERNEMKKLKKTKQHDKLNQGTFKMDDEVFAYAINRACIYYNGAETALEKLPADSPHQTKLRELQELEGGIKRIFNSELKFLEKGLKKSPPINADQIDESFKKFGVHLYILGRIHREVHSILKGQNFTEDERNVFKKSMDDSMHH